MKIEKILTYVMLGAIAVMGAFTVVGLIVIDKGEFNKPAPPWMNIPCMVMAIVFFMAFFWLLAIWAGMKQKPVEKTLGDV